MPRYPVEVTKDTIGSVTRTLPAICLIAAALITVTLLPPATEAAEPGRGELTTTQGGYPLDVFTYRPAGCAPQGVLLVFHGNSRNADDYRDYARPFADRSCLTVYAPHFDRGRFRSWAYHRGGVIRRGTIRWRSEWTVSIIQGLAQWALAQTGGPDKPVFLFGHSAGGQFVSRVAAYAPFPGVQRYVVANPSTHVWPSLDESVPYGFGLFPDADAALKNYLNQPVTIYLGSRDTGSRLLTRTSAAVRQGENRLDRGQKTFKAARALARGKGWNFNWKMVIADGVRHSARGMFRAPEANSAFGLENR